MAIVVGTVPLHALKLSNQNVRQMSSQAISASLRETFSCILSPSAGRVEDSDRGEPPDGAPSVEDTGTSF